MVKEKDEQNSSNKKSFLLIFIVILLIINAVLLYLVNQAKQEVIEKTVIIENKDTEIKVYSIKLDSIQRELQARYDEVAKLNGDTAAMGQLIRQLKLEKRSLANEKSNIEAKYNQIKSQFDQIMVSKDQEIDALRTERDELFKQNNDLKRKQVSLADSLNTLKFSKDELEKQVNMAAVLKAANIKAIYIRKDKEVDAIEYKAKKVEKVKITLEILENKVAKIENKTFYLRVIEPDGATIYDLAQGGGSFIVDDKEIYYTSRQELLYDQLSKFIQFYFSKPMGTYKVGKHVVEIYCEGKKIGIGGFTLL